MGDRVARSIFSDSSAQAAALADVLASSSSSAPNADNKSDNGSSSYSSGLVRTLRRIGARQQSRDADSDLKQPGGSSLGSGEQKAREKGGGDQITILENTRRANARELDRPSISLPRDSGANVSGRREDGHGKLSSLGLDMFSSGTNPQAHAQQPNDDSDIDAGVFAMQGRRPSMEDTHVVCKSLMPPASAGPNALPKSVFAVFDGHGGAEVAAMCEQILVPALCNQPNFWNMHEDRAVTQAMAAAFLEMDQQILKAADERAWISGCTGVVCAFSDRDKVFVANVGDSEAQLGGRLQPTILTHVHKPDDDSERARIKAAGGAVVNKRVNGLLAVSRSFGDREFKRGRNGLIADFVSCEPYTACCPVASSQDFLVLACDGLWDVFSHDEVSARIAHANSNGNSAEAAAKEVAVAAYEKGSSDNISVVVVYLPKRQTTPKADLKLLPTSGDYGSVADFLDLPQTHRRPDDSNAYGIIADVSNYSDATTNNGNRNELSDGYDSIADAVSNASISKAPGTNMAVAHAFGAPAPQQQSSVVFDGTCISTASAGLYGELPLNDATDVVTPLAASTQVSMRQDNAANMTYRPLPTNLPSNSPPAATNLLSQGGNVSAQSYGRVPTDDVFGMPQAPKMGQHPGPRTVTDTMNGYGSIQDIAITVADLDGHPPKADDSYGSIASTKDFADGFVLEANSGNMKQVKTAARVELKMLPVLLALLHASPSEQRHDTLRHCCNLVCASGHGARHMLESVIVLELYGSQVLSAAGGFACVPNPDSAHTVFRGSSTASLLSSFAAREWLVKTFSPTVERVLLGKFGGFEIDPSQDDSSDRLDRLANLLRAANEIINAITVKADGIPRLLRLICALIAKHTHQAFSDAGASFEFSGHARNAVQTFFFLRFVVPFILSPEDSWPERFGKPSPFRCAIGLSGGFDQKLESVTPLAQRNLLLLSKVVQQVGNGHAFQDEDYMACCNEWVCRRLYEVNHVLKELSDPAILDEQPATHDTVCGYFRLSPSPRDKLEAMNALHDVLAHDVRKVCNFLDVDKSKKTADLIESVRAVPITFNNGLLAPSHALLPERQMTSKELENEQKYQLRIEEAENTDVRAFEVCKALIISGTDEFGRKVVVFMAERYDPSLDWQKFFLFFVKTLDRIVEQDYVFVYYHTKEDMDKEHRPTFVSFLKRCYPLFNRKFKKNLKQLFVLRPSKWLKTTIANCCKPSKKFTNKVTYVEAKDVPAFASKLNLPATRLSE